MATKAEIDEVFINLREDLQSKMDGGDYNVWFEELRRLHLAVATCLREFQQRPGHGDASDAYNPALDAGSSALKSSQALKPGDEAGLRRLRQLVIHAADELQLVTARALLTESRTFFSSGLRGALRVSPQAAPPSEAQLESVPGPMAGSFGGLEARAAGTPPSPPPAYIASVAALFPLEAATLFPLGRSIAGTNATALTIILALIIAFIITLRYFATQPEGGGPPSVKEIIIAVISFLLWVGALGGYWLPIAKPLLDWHISLDLGEKLYGFATIMWVAIVPYFVRKPTPAP